MGTFRMISNSKLSKQAKKRHQICRQKLRNKRRAKGMGKITGQIMDPELTTIHHLKKRRTSSRANITLSGKKKHKLIKQLKRMSKEKSRMEAETSEAGLGSSFKKSKFRDVEMSEATEDEPSTSQSMKHTAAADDESMSDKDMENTDT